MFLDGFGFAGYRSFRHPVQRIGPLRKINLFVGQNNAGKSNVLSFLTCHFNRIYSSLVDNRFDLQFDPIDHPLGDTSKIVTVDLGVRIDSDYYRRLISDYSGIKEFIERLFTSDPISDQSGLAWFRFSNISINEQMPFDRDFIRDIINSKSLHPEEWTAFRSRFSSSGSSDLGQTIHTVLKHLSPISKPLPPIDIIPAVRRIGEKGETSTDYSGLDLIERLAQLQNPGVLEQEKKQDFNRIAGFLRLVTGNASAEIEVPYGRDSILVRMDGRTLPLSSLGTGIHQVVILAAAATVLHDQILCIEEPELHLHPLLQRKLLRYLAQETTNQYFITTHSAHLLEAVPDAAIFHIRYLENATTIESAATPAARSAICADLGYKASDILQANCVIWVEGPSDRLYLRHWISCLDHDLIEGIHYSIMFYGGRLLRHLTADDPEIEDFISLRRLNRFISIIIDSDRKSAHSHLNSTKKRVQKEFDGGAGFAWVTNGREIENYVDPAVLVESVRTVHPQAVRLATVGRFDHPLFYVNGKGQVVEKVDKVKVAHEVVRRSTLLDILDLREQVGKVVEFIHAAND